MRITTTSTRTARTEWFRQAGSWPLLARFLGSAPHEPHAYVAGTATGEDAFSLAMILEEQCIPGRITATDIDPELIALAEHPRFSPYDVRQACAAGPLSPAAVLRHLSRDGDAYVPHQRLRARIRFDVADLRHAEIERADVVLARNLWRHLGDAGVQSAAAAVRRSLLPGGLLSVGGADLLGRDGGPTTLDPVLRLAGLRPVGFASGLYFAP